MLIDIEHIQVSGYGGARRRDDDVHHGVQPA